MARNRLVQGWDPDMIAKDHHIFCKCCFAAMWNCLDGPGILSVAAEMFFILIFNSVQAVSIVVRRRLSAG